MGVYHVIYKDTSNNTLVFCEIRAENIAKAIEKVRILNPNSISNLTIDLQYYE